MSKYLVSLLSLSGALMAAQNGACPPEPPAPCYLDNCTRCYCLGPENIIANAPVCPLTCNGDFRIEVAGLYWQATEDGLEYAIDNNVRSPGSEFSVVTQNIGQLNNLVNAKYEEPDFKWDYGFKVGLSYCMACDGWDIGARWTWFRGKSNTELDADEEDNHTLLPLWSAFVSPFVLNPSVGLVGINYATEIETHWSAKFNIVDIELGRQFWTSKYLSIRPLVGIRILFIDQDYQIQHSGGSYGPIFIGTVLTVAPINNTVDLTNDYKGVGLRGGLDTSWHLGCGWGIFGDLAASIIYGRFNMRHAEENRLANSPFSKTKIAEIKESFRASRSVLDLALGIEWGGLICDCKYGINIALAWEQHIFFHQNQLWRITRVSQRNPAPIPQVSLPQNGLDDLKEENNFEQSRGTLSTQGLTLRFGFDF